MKITTHLVEKITISGLPYQDAISVFIEDIGPRYGRVTIACFNDAWSYAWGGLPDNQTMSEFFIRAGTDYLVKKLSTGIRCQQPSDDVAALHRHLRARICAARRRGDISKASVARAQYDGVPGMDYSDSEALYGILGDDWHLDLPMEPNPEYERLSDMVNAIREGLAAKRTERNTVDAVAVISGNEPAAIRAG